VPQKRNYPAATAVPGGAAKRECTRARCATSGSRNNADAKHEMPAARRTAPGGCIRRTRRTLQVRSTLCYSKKARYAKTLRCKKHATLQKARYATKSTLRYKARYATSTLRYKKHATLRVRTACPQCQCLSIKRLLALLLGRTRALRPLLAGSGRDTALFSVVQAESALCRAACSYIPFL